jgi:hypothetical protein
VKALGAVAVLVLGCGGKHFSGDADADVDAPCEDGTELGGSETGLVLCAASEDVYRVGPASCEASTYACTYGVGHCSTDADCGPDEVCTDQPSGACDCVTPCTTDEECAADELCLCEAADLGFPSQCLSADCRTPDDCPGGNCAMSRNLCFDPESFMCRRPADQCTSNDDCPVGLYCGHDPAALGWYCEDRGVCD